MKKTLVLILLLSLVLSSFPAVAEEDFVGMWELTAILIGKRIYYPSDYDYESRLLLWADGIGFLETSNQGEYGSVIFPWTVEGNSIRLYTEQYGDLVYVPTQNGLRLTLENQVSLYARQKDWLTEDTQTVPAQAVEDFLGTWTLQAVSAYGDGVRHLLPASVVDTDRTLCLYLDEKSGILGYIIDMNGAFQGKMYPLGGFRIEDGVLKGTAAGADGEFSLTVYENGWISLTLRTDVFPYTGYFAKASEETPYRLTVAKYVRIQEGSNPNVRTLPSMEGSRIGVARSGHRYELLGVEDGWCKIRLEDGQEGWIAGGMVAGVE